IVYLKSLLFAPPVQVLILGQRLNRRRAASFSAPLATYADHSLCLRYSVDNRNSSAAKRARTDGGRREDDWTCPSCGNVNFSFRTTCNMRNCTQSRPADHNGKSAPKHMQSPQSFSSPGRYLGSGGPPPVYMGGSPYGSSLFNGSMPPYDVPFSGGSPYHFNYSSRLPAGAHYRPLHMSGPPPPYHGGSMMGSGGMYGMPPPPMNRYGLGMAMGPAAAAAMMPRSGYYPDEKSLKRDSTRENDWTCPNCGNVNFSFRIVCNMRKCNTPKPGPQLQQGGSSDQISKQKAPEGSWKCDNCGNINYPFRNKCNRQNCGADKPGDHSNESPSDAPEENDQVRYATYLCSHICLLINCLPRKLADVTVRLDFMSSESSGYLFMKKSTQSVESKI
ncbi:unnamed protein product, partial [Brassica oleracea]